MMEFTKGGIIENQSIADSIPARLAPGTVMIKRSVWDKDKGKSILPLVNVQDSILIIDDDEWNRKFPRL